MKCPVSVVFLLIASCLLVKVQSSSVTSNNKNLRSSSNVHNMRHDGGKGTSDALEKDRLLVTYSFNGFKTTRYFNSSYSKTTQNRYRKSFYNKDYGFDYNRTNSFDVEAYYNSTNYYDDDRIIDDGSLQSKVAILQVRFERLFSTPPTYWSGAQWGLFVGIFGFVIALVATSTLCCYHFGQKAGMTGDKLSGDDEETLYDGDDNTIFDDETVAASHVTTPVANKSENEGTAYVRMSGSTDKPGTLC